MGALPCAQQCCESAHVARLKGKVPLASRAFFRLPGCSVQAAGHGHFLFDAR